MNEEPYCAECERLMNEYMSHDDATDLCEQAAQLSDKLDDLITDARLADMEMWPSLVAGRYAKLCRVAYKANRRWERRGGGRETEEDYDQVY